MIQKAFIEWELHLRHYIRHQLKKIEMIPDFIAFKMQKGDTEQINTFLQLL